MSTHLQPAPAWHKNSLFRALRTVAETYENDLPHDVYVTIQEAAGRVQVHEAYISDKCAHLDRSIVYNGYKNSLTNVSMVVNRLGLQESESPAGKICGHILMTLQDILIVIESKSNDVGQLFSDSEMSKLLVKLAGALWVDWIFVI
ncbi:hypothetical protein RSOLAG22IIIB_08408 [Rhizoctonia solani]|uniref:Uncharacterized protein n=1 Tax=Rhizoctonia solani TaxID=456999 RepID=A0A0K6FTE3_9AGAM|nr:hypothetical protein RSOLAG22IIIB_08408 [Rhizoctonia solani]